MKRKGTPTPISALLGTVLDEVGLTRVLDEKKIKDSWEEIVGKRITEIAEIDSLTKDKLYIKVSNPVWKMELNFQKGEIAKRVNEKLEWKAVKEVVFI